MLQVRLGWFLTTLFGESLDRGRFRDALDPGLQAFAGVRRQGRTFGERITGIDRVPLLGRDPGERVERQSQTDRRVTRNQIHLVRADRPGTADPPRTRLPPLPLDRHDEAGRR